MDLDFDWKYYLSIHPDLPAAGINSEQAARDHWMNYGKSEGRKCKRDKVLVISVPITQPTTVFQQPVQNQTEVSKKFTIVVARYKEDISLFKPFKDYLMIYNKGPDDIPQDFPRSSIKNLPNVGREGGTYVNHIVENYNNGGVNKDLSEIFEPYTSGTIASTTNFIVENYNGTGLTKDLNLIFKPL